ncbi:hypothetical protein [Erythrobacter sp. QSSC1-22B]|uniref:hypothetical protein n=1 Tax=Erythrobacter sp. QSSC1-22B TaxID=1860125 RepID=UPI0011A9FE46|nr:hypothetical protein [Erythrobacter sp. QSSC1-22B]
MEKLAFGYNCDHGFDDDSRASDGFGWFYVSAKENGKPCRARFWADRSRMNAFATAILNQAKSARFPLETHWDDEQDGRAFHLTISECVTSADLKVHLRVDRCGTRGGEVLCCAFTTSKIGLRTFNDAMTDMINQRCAKATLSGW